MLVTLRCRRVQPEGEGAVPQAAADHRRHRLQERLPRALPASRCAQHQDGSSSQATLGRLRGLALVRHLSPHPRVQDMCSFKWISRSGAPLSGLCSDPEHFDSTHFARQFETEGFLLFAWLSWSCDPTSRARL